MPYIPVAIRARLTRARLSGLPLTIVGPGELNFVLTKTLLDYIDVNGLSYQTINDVIGALEAAKIEFYRRRVVEYETRKIEENSDVYE